MDDCEIDRIIGRGGKCGCVKKPKTKATKSTLDSMQELGKKYGVKVTDMSERGIRAIGFLGGIAGKQRKRQAHDPKTNRRQALGE